MRTGSPPGGGKQKFVAFETGVERGDSGGRRGRVRVVGIGPGGFPDLTRRAEMALTEADVVLGYGPYLSLVETYLDGKKVVASGMTQERERARLAVEEAAQGQEVVVVSSGDPGVYGMAGPVIDSALRAGVEVEVVPGVTAATAAAAILGAPLMHDFAVISLSDLLTPWEVIARRLEAAAAADFIIVLYNPKSRGRTEQIGHAIRIILQYRPGSTPAGLVRNASRPGQTKVVTDLHHLLEQEIDMFSTIIIGNSQTFVRSGYLVTPRGYGS